uniref:CSON012913 protein n=1 Tax=Culicoides sonorensis TaxID=179676 RepID=A0A336MAW9_CULSO
MHDLFTKVLSHRDLSRAGDLFTVADAEIVTDLTEVLKEINKIISQPSYLQNTNEQSVIEICIARTLACIRDAHKAELHCKELVDLLETCLAVDNLQPSAKNVDPPHAKIASDIISSIFLNYNSKKQVMVVSIPVAVKFLSKGNRELSRNLASYLSLAVIEHSNLLSPHVGQILDSILTDNYGLSRILLALYETNPEPITRKCSELVEIIPKCEIQEKLALLQLLANIAKTKPSALHGSLPQLCELLSNSSTVQQTMIVFLRLSEQRPLLILEYTSFIKAAASTPQTINLAAQILSAIGKLGKEHAQIALDFVLEHLPNADRTSHTILIQEARKLCTQYPVLFNEKLTAVVRQRNILLQQQNGTTENNHIIKNGNSDHINKTSGGITIVKLNSPASQNIPQMNLNKSQTSIMQHNNNFVHAAATTSPVINNNHNSQVYAITSPGGSNQAGNHHVGQVTGNGGVNSYAVTSPTPHTGGYTRRAKLGDSRSTGRLHPSGTRSMTRLNIGSVGGLHKSMTRLSSSQLNQNGSNTNTTTGGVQTNGNSQNLITSAVPPLSQQVVITGENRYGIPILKSGCVTVTTTTRPYSQGPLGSSHGFIGKGLIRLKDDNDLNSTSALNQSTGSIGGLVVQHATPEDKATTQSMNTQNLPISVSNNNEVSVSGPSTEVTRRYENKSITLLNAAQRGSVFDPWPMRDVIQHFCEKHLDKIRAYTKNISKSLPPPAKCTIEEKRNKKTARLQFVCQIRGPHCLYSKTFFAMKTKNPKTWIHLMFLDLQARAPHALVSYDPSVSSLRHCWDTLKCENKTFITLVTSAFPSSKDTDALVNELQQCGFFDVFELGPPNQTVPEDSSVDDFQFKWGCFLCNHPEKAMGFLDGNNVIEGQLKEKKGKWRLFRRWRTRYFTLSGAHLSCKGSSGGESIDVNQIRSVKVSRGARNIPKAFEIFTGDQTLILKPKDGKNAEEWVQCLSIVVAHSQARDVPPAKTNSLPARSFGSRFISE